MVHHFLYFAPGRVDEGPGSCWRGAGFIGGRGEEHPLGHPQMTLPKSARDTYGIVNRKADGTAPDWSLTAMVMNHYKRPKSFYVRTRVWYTTDARKSILPVVIGNCAQLANGMSYDVPGGGKKGSNYVNSSDWVAPFSGRMLVASSHQHGGGKYQTLDSRTCKRRLFKAPVYHGLPSHPYNSIRPILHEPGPIGTGAYATAEGIPIVKGEVLRRTAVHDDHNLHVASMGFWATWFVADDSVKRCGKMPDDVVEINKPKHYDKTPNYDLVVPQLSKPKGVFSAFDGTALEVGDGYLDLRRRRSAQRDRRQRPARLLVGLLGPADRQLHGHADGEGHVQARLPGAPDHDGGDARRQVAGGRTTPAVAQRNNSWSSPPAARIVSVPPSAVARPAPNTRRRVPGGSACSASITTTACPPRSTWRLARSTASSAACA
jgi:hypothetical protein